MYQHPSLVCFSGKGKSDFRSSSLCHMVLGYLPMERAMAHESSKQFFVCIFSVESKMRILYRLCCIGCVLKYSDRMDFGMFIVIFRFDFLAPIPFYLAWIFLPVLFIDNYRR